MISDKTRNVLNKAKHKLGMTSVEDPDLDAPNQLRRYLKENMAEGYLSEEEGVNIDEFVDEYERLLEVEKDAEEIIQEVYGEQVR